MGTLQKLFEDTLLQGVRDCVLKMIVDKCSSHGVDLSTAVRNYGDVFGR